MVERAGGPALKLPVHHARRVHVYRYNDAVLTAGDHWAQMVQPHQETTPLRISTGRRKSLFGALETVP